MRSSILCLAAAFSLLAAPGVAAAGVMAPVAQAASPVAPAEGGANLVLVAGGCGRGFHRGPYGHCRPNVFRPRPVHHFRRCERRMTPYGWRSFCRYY